VPDDGRALLAAFRRALDGGGDVSALERIGSPDKSDVPKGMRFRRPGLLDEAALQHEDDVVGAGRPIAACALRCDFVAMSPVTVRSGKWIRKVCAACPRTRGRRRVRRRGERG
jgi:hypothetical protein